jgi:hypothetical protein
MFRSLVVVAAVVLAACGGADPLTGVVVEDVRPVADVDRLLVGDGLRVEVTVAPDADPAVSVTADTGVLDRVLTSDANGALEIGSTSSGAIEAEIRVTLRDLRGLVVDSQARVLVGGTIERLTVDAAGSAGVDLTPATIGSIDVDLRAAAAVTLGEVAEVTGFVGVGAGLRLPTRAPLGDVTLEDGAFLEIADETQDS